MTFHIAPSPARAPTVTPQFTLAPVLMGKPVVLPGQGPTVALVDVRTFDSAIADALVARLDHSKTLEGGLRVTKADAAAVLSPDELARFDSVCNGLMKVAQVSIDKRRALWGIGGATTLITVAAALSGEWVVGAFLGTTAMGLGVQAASMVSDAYDRKALSARASVGIPEAIKAMLRD